MTKKYPTLKNLAPLFFLLCSIAAFSQTQIFTTSGTFTVPVGVTQITVEAWGGGGGGGSVGNGYVGGAGGGGGGAYASSLITVSPNNSYPVAVGLGGASNFKGTNSTFNTSIVIAEGGLAGNGNTSSAGVGGRIANSTGATKYGGGSGADGYNLYSPVTDYNSGGGGGGAGSSGNGGDALGKTSGTGTTPNGGNGGAGMKIHGNGNAGNLYGGGGGGAVRTTANEQNGGSGASGLVVISWRTITTGTISPTSYCAGANVSIPYTITGNYIAGNIFTAQLSNASGSFVSPVNIGTLTSAAAGTISGTIPVGTVAGTGYRIRVVSSNPSNTLSNNGSNLTVNTLPTQPTVGIITQPTCSLATGNVALSGLPATGTWTLTRSPGAVTSTGTGTSKTISGLSAGTYNFTVTNASNCSSVASANVVINAQPANNVWNGSISTNWNTAGNWCTGVPTIGVANTLDVVIPSGLTNYPIIYSGATAGYVKTIVLENNTILNVRENSLRVTDNLTLNGIIDLEGESQLLQDTGSSFDAASTGYIKIDQQGTGNSFRYNYWTSPVNSRGTKFTIDEVLRDGNGTITNKNITYGAAYAFAEQNIDSSPIQLSTYWMYVLRNSGSGYAAWFRVGNTGEILVGEGYTIKGSNTSADEQNYTFVGKPNNGNISLTLNAGFDYLVGNPYPSAINAAQFLLDNTSTTGVIYFWEHYGGDTHNLAGYQAGYATRNLLDGVPATSAVGVSNLVPPGLIKKIPGPYIAVGQAFFVVGGAGNSQIQFNNGQRDFVKESSGNAVFMKSRNTKVKTENIQAADLRPKFRIGFDAPKISHRQLLLGVDERATKAIDWGFDAEIYEIFADDMYWILDGKKFVIQGTNSVGLNSEVPLGIQLSKTGVVTVKIDALENIDEDTSIYLKDKLTGESFNMRDKPAELNLVAGKYADRFVLIFKTQKLVAEEVKAEILISASVQPIVEGIHVFMNNDIGEIQIKNNSTEEILSVALVNTLGQTIKTWNSNFNIRTISLPLSTATGVYLVQITTKTGNTVKKISVE